MIHEHKHKSLAELPARLVPALSRMRCLMEGCDLITIEKNVREMHPIALPRTFGCAGLIVITGHGHGHNRYGMSE